MTISAVLFDLDGVLIDSEPAHFVAFKRTLADYGYPLTHDDYSLHFAGTTDRDGFTSFKATSGLIADIALLCAAKTRHYSRAAGSITGIPASIATVKQLAGTVPLALVTGSSLMEATVALKTIGLDAHFPVIISADDVTNGKPHPEGYLLAAQALNVDPNGCIVIEDSPSGVHAAKQAGMVSVAITTTHPASQLQNADWVVESIEAAFIADFLA